MRILMLLFLLTATKAYGQPNSGPIEFPKNERLSIDANSIFRTNKFLDFKNQDTLLEMIDGAVYKTTELNKYFGTTDWKAIEAEDTSTYRRAVERYPTTKYHYSYTDTSMTESHEESNRQYDLHKDLKTVYNLKGFITYQEKKTQIGGRLFETQSVTNTFDRQNRVIQIVEKTVRNGKEPNSESVIRAVYAGNTVTVKSKNGTIVCRFISSKKIPEPVSNLSSRQTADAFMDALGRQQFDVVQTYCTVDLAKRMRAFAVYHYEIEKLDFQKGSATLTATGVTIKDLWKMRLKGQEADLYEVDFELVKATDGWKVEDFDFRPKP